MYFIKTPRFFKFLFLEGIWKIDNEAKKLFLTFDDGPVPEVTQFVLDTLNEYDVKATFFCVGENAEKHPALLKRIKQEGHAVGSHTYNHLNGWYTDNTEYFLNVRKAAKIVGSDLFRPPYGKLKPSQVSFIRKHYQIIMWDVLSGDFDPKLSTEEIYENIVTNVESGSIIVMHDSIKSEEKLKVVLPQILRFLLDSGYEFETLASISKIKPQIHANIGQLVTI
ncbi:MAG TPA: polysaccharide deacetylase family protein [Saprospiraceae bacterium]|nr:polysaccharide deacetylase family protein [Saprospiraceae bacterium]